VGEPEEEVVGRIVFFSVWIRNVLDGVLARHGLHASEFAVLRLLATSDYAGRVGEMARRLRCDHGTVSRLVTNLENGGLVVRLEYRPNRRERAIRLTDDGEARYRATLAAMTARQCFSALDEESAELVYGVLGRVAEACPQKRRLREHITW
jgi:DNA-binding MarR family transcriptional regulator